MSGPAAIIEEARRQGAVGDLELAFARFVARLDPQAGEALLIAAALAVGATRQGHVCIALNEAAGSEFCIDGRGEPVCLPELAPWLETLRRSPVVGEPGAFAPLILDHGHRLYLHRYWQYERELGADLGRRAKELIAVDEARLAAGLDRLFPPAREEELDCQRLAAAVAALRRLAVVSGGPGTGKTFTVVRLLALLQELAAPVGLRIGLAAPTGKAAGRLQESIRIAKAGLAASPDVLERIPDEAATIHRLLGTRFGSPFFRHHRDNPLPLDVLVVDEASMVDLALMAKLVRALPEAARLVLLGDKDQLASVEAGSVLGDVCSGKEVNGFSRLFAARLARAGFQGLPVADGAALADSIVLLERSFRFESAGGIGILARAVNRGDAASALAVLQAPDQEELAFYPWQEAESLDRLRQAVRHGFAEYLTAESPAAALDSFNRFRLLCAHRRGRFGVGAMNGWIEGELARAGLIRRDGLWYQGRPVMISRNHPPLHLYNGDIGITLPDGEGRLRVFFAGAEGGLRSFAPARIPEHETAFALTVHKSQGSEFDAVALLLPERISPVLSRELVYTAVTRARTQFALWGDEAVLQAAIDQRVRRTSGLRELLWG